MTESLIQIVYYCPASTTVYCLSSWSLCWLWVWSTLINKNKLMCIQLYTLGESMSRRLKSNEERYLQTVLQALGVFSEPKTVIQLLIYFIITIILYQKRLFIERYRQYRRLVPRWCTINIMPVMMSIPCSYGYTSILRCIFCDNNTSLGMVFTKGLIIF